VHIYVDMSAAVLPRLPPLLYRNLLPRNPLSSYRPRRMGRRYRYANLWNLWGLWGRLTTIPDLELGKSKTHRKDFRSTALGWTGQRVP